MWYSRKYVEVNYYIKQILSGYFTKYLYNMVKTLSCACVTYGDEPQDDANHTFFKCP